MAAPVLNDYEYQYKDTGFKLNANVALPFLDVSKTTGLSDLPDYDAKIDDVDSQDGGLIYAKFSKSRIITVEGILYVSPSTVEATIDTLIANFTPDNTDWPFYFKHPGVAQRYINCKALGFKSDVETLRRIGASNCLITLGAENPIKRVDNANLTLAVAGTNYNVTNSGLAVTYPIITITGGTASVIVLTNSSTGASLTLTRSFIGSDVTVVDMRRRVVYVNGVQNSAVVTAGSFWTIGASTTVSLKYTFTGTVAPTSVVVASYSGWM
jgi:hypothetical protein